MIFMCICFTIIGYLFFNWIAGDLGIKVFTGILIFLIGISIFNSCTSNSDVDSSYQTDSYTQRQLEAELAEASKSDEDYANKLPYNGMNVNKLKYTSLGNADKITTMVSLHTYTHYYWYDSYGNLIAKCTTTSRSNGDDEIYAFEYYGEDYGYDENGIFIEETAESSYSTIECISIVGSQDLLVNETYSYTIEFNPKDCDIEEIKWQSSDENVAIITNDGSVSALSSGSTTITAITLETGYTASLDITIHELSEPLTLTTDYTGGKSIVGNNYSIDYDVDANASGGTSSYQYKFELIQNGTITQTVDWSNDNSISCVLDGNGTCELIIYAKDDSGDVVSETINFLSTITAPSSRIDIPSIRD